MNDNPVAVQVLGLAVVLLMGALAAVGAFVSLLRCGASRVGALSGAGAAFATTVMLSLTAWTVLGG